MSDNPWRQVSESAKKDGMLPVEDNAQQNNQTQLDKRGAPGVEESIASRQAAVVGSAAADAFLAQLRSQMNPAYQVDPGSSRSGLQSPPDFVAVQRGLVQNTGLPPTDPAADGMASQMATIAFLTQHQIDTSPPVVRFVFLSIEQHLGIHRLYTAMGLGGFFALYMIFGYFAQLLCNLVGFAIPAYASMRAIESTSKSDDTKWLTYWVVFACFSCVDFFADSILRYFPFYWLAKIIFLVYCFFPSERNGSVVLYSRLIRPYFLHSQGSVDAAVKNLASSATAGFESALRK
ncbi:unnamed protein product [Ixodes persulcatus]